MPLKYSRLIYRHKGATNSIFTTSKIQNYMNTFSTGQSSISYCFAKNFLGFMHRQGAHLAPCLRLLAIALLLVCAQALHAATPSECPQPAADCPYTYTWTASIHLNCVVSDPTVISKLSLFMGHEGFEGFYDNIALQSDGRTIVYTLSGPSPTLPTNAEIAEITVADPDCGGTRTFLAHADGSTSILIMDEF